MYAMGHAYPHKQMLKKKKSRLSYIFGKALGSCSWALVVRDAQCFSWMVGTTESFY